MERNVVVEHVRMRQCLVEAVRKIAIALAAKSVATELVRMMPFHAVTAR